MIDAGMLTAVAIGHKGLNTLMPESSSARAGAAVAAAKRPAIISVDKIFLIRPPSLQTITSLLE
jgi:hypothetical protein